MGSQPEFAFERGRYGRYVGALGIIAFIGVLGWLLIAKPHSVGGIEPGKTVPPFAVPLATGSLEGAADTAIHRDEGLRGKVQACRERGKDVLNICELYERGPVVLALFIDGESCPAVLSEMQTAAARFPDVSFAAVAVKGDHASSKRLVRRRALTIPVGFDEEGALAGLYKMVSCPQLSFIYPGGVMQSKPLLEAPSPAMLARRVSGLLAASKARGWKPPIADAEAIR
jgi:AhpC/TSA family